MRICPECKEAVPPAQTSCETCGADVSGTGEVDADDMVGMKLGGRYELRELLGQGAMGWIYRGEHASLGSSVAVKLMKPQLRPDEFRAKRFSREAKASSRLNHPNIVATIDFGETRAGLLYLVTEYVRGEPLSRLVDREGALSPSRAIGMVVQVLQALEESHSHGIVHRDIKTENLMVTPLADGEELIKVLDFGIAKQLKDEGPRLTFDGQIFGTPDYMSPEQIRSQEITGATDLYSTGVVLFELLTARLPYRGDNIFDIMKDHLYASTPKLAHCGVDKRWAEALQPVLETAMAKEPSERYADALEFRQTLQALLRRGRRGAADGTWSKRPRGSLEPPWWHEPKRTDQESGVGAGSPGEEFAKGPALANEPPVFEEQGAATEKAKRRRKKRALATADTTQVGVEQVERSVSEAARQKQSASSSLSASPRSARHAEPSGSIHRRVTVPGPGPGPGPDEKKAPSEEAQEPKQQRLTERLLSLTPNSLKWVNVEGQKVLEAVLRATGKGEGQGEGEGVGVQLIGAAGVGKSALARWAATQAVDAGFDVVWIEPEPVPTPGPWGAVRRAVEQVLGVRFGAQGPSRAALEEAVSGNKELARELPGLMELFGLPGPLADAEEGVRKCESLSALVRVLFLTPGRRRFLVFDDAHRFDRLSRLALLRLAALCKECEHRFLITSEVPLFSLQSGWREVTLEPWSQELLHHAVEDLNGQYRDLAQGLRREMASNGASQGWTPLWVEQTLAAAAESGNFDMQAVARSEAPLGEVMSLRLAVLPRLARKLLQAVAVFGGSATMEDLSALLPGERFRQKDRVVLIRRGYIHDPSIELSTDERGRSGQVPSGQTLSIAHPVITEAVRVGIPSGEKREFHRRALDILSDKAPPHILAFHADEAGADEQAMRLYLAAANDAEHCLDANGAAHFYKRARDLARWRLLLDETSPAHVDMSVRFARSLLAKEDLSAAEVVFKSVEAEAADDPRLASWVGMGLADILMLQNRPNKAVETLTTALGRILPSGDMEILAETYLGLGNLLVAQENPERALDELQEGLDMVTLGQGVTWEGAPNTLWKLLLRMADLGRRRAKAQTGEERNTTLHQCLVWGGGALAQARRLGSPLGRARAHSVISRVCAALAMETQRARHAAEALEALEVLGDRRGQARCLLDMARMGPSAPEVYRRAAFKLGGEVHWCEEISP